MKKQWHKFTKKNSHLKTYQCTWCLLNVKSEGLPDQCRNCRKKVFRPVS